MSKMWFRDYKRRWAKFGKVLEEPLVPGAVVDEGEIDDELEAMEQEERRERGKRRRPRLQEGGCRS
jgi:hypothetical protein